MNQRDFLMALYDALDGLPAEIRAETISEYREYFRTEAEKGRTEEEISASLGDPVSLAIVIKSRRGYNPNQNPNAYANPGPHSKVRPNVRRSFIPRLVLWVIVAMVLSGMFFGMSFVGKGGNNMLFGIGNRYDVNELKEIDFVSANRIEVRVSSADTTLFTSDAMKVKAAMTGQVITTADADSVPTLEITQTGDVITIEERRRPMGIIVSFSSDLKLDISIPKSFTGEVAYKSSSGNFTTSNQNLKSLSMELTSGDVDLKNITLTNDLNVTMTSGDLNINKLEAGNAILRATSGDRKLTGLSMSGGIQVNAHSGNTIVNDADCQQLTVECTSGEIKVDQCTANLSFLKSHSGNIVLKELDGAARIEATSGNIEVSAVSPKGEYNLSCTSGNINLFLPANTGFKLYARATSGNVNCGFDLDHKVTGRNSLEGTNGTGEIPITIKATSGNIRIAER